jgi:hypothetical protein
MRLDVTVQRQSKIIKWIIVVVIASIFVAFALAVGVLCVHTPNESQILGLGLESSDDPGNEHCVPVAFKYEIGPFDTEKGEIELVDFYFPYINKATGELLPLPLCITNTMAESWWFELRIKGGYTPETTDLYWPELGISFWQDQNKDDVPEMIQGWNLEYDAPVKDESCDCCSCYTIIGRPAWCGNTVCLHSNQYPDLKGGLECFTSQCPEDQSGVIPGKEVTMKIGLLFSGCPLESQQFAYILAQKRCYFPQQKSPTPE